MTTGLDRHQFQTCRSSLSPIWQRAHHLTHSNGAPRTRLNGVICKFRFCRIPLLGLCKLQRCGVDAVTQPRGFRAVGENMPQVCVATTARNRDSPHSKTTILHGLHISLCNRLPEARPARAGIELCAGIEQCSSATGAPIDTVVMQIPKSSCKSPFRAVVPRDFESLCRKLRFPFFFAFHNLRHARSALVLACV